MRIYLLVAAMFVLYLLPWVVNPAASLTPNGYELAEWTSLHPAVRGAEPPLLVSFLLRLPLVCLALFVAFSVRRGILPVVILLLVVAALLPPELIQATDNPNSRQQGALALFTLAAGMVGISGIFPRYRKWVAAAVGVVGALASAVGLVNSIQLMRGFQLPAGVGIGGIALVIGFSVLVGLLMLKPNRTARRLP